MDWLNFWYVVGPLEWRFRSPLMTGHLFRTHNRRLLHFYETWSFDNQKEKKIIKANMQNLTV